MNNKTKKTVKRIVNLFLCIMTFFTCITYVPAYAVDDQRAIDMQQNAAQIGDHYKVSQENGMPTDEMITKGSNTFVTDTGDDNWNVWVDKTIAPSGLENLFEITLKVKTKTKISEIAKPKDAAVVLVFDLSSSMDYPLGNTSTKRLAAAKNAAQEFLELYAQTNGGERKIAIVGFHLDGFIAQGWAETSSLLEVPGENNPNLCKAIDDLEWESGTNVAAGLLMARNLLEDSAYEDVLSGIEYKSVILLSDGMPYRYLDTGKYNFGKTSYTRYDGLNGDNHKSHDQAVTAANYILEDGIEINTVFCGDSTETVPQKSGTRNCKYCNSNIKALDYLRDISSTVVEATDADKLSEAFKDIEEKIEIATQAWQGSDPMGANGQLIEITSNTNAGEVTSNAEGLKWNLLNATPTEETLANGTKIYTYSVKYNVQLNTLRDTFDANIYYQANNATELKYYILDENGNKGEDQSIFFNIPSIKGYEGGMYRLVKVDENNNGLGGATFTLTHKPHEETCTNGHIHTCDEAWTYSVESDENGYVDFKNIPSGHEYILQETSAPDGYQMSGETHLLKVDYSKVTIDGEENKQLTIVNKEIKYVDVEGSKTWVNDEGVQRPNSITVNLYGTYEKEGTTYYVTGLDTSTTEPTPFSTKTVRASDGWKWSWNDVYEFCEDHKVTWSVEEENVNGYIAIVDGMNITNVYSQTTDNEIDYIGTKNWVGDSVVERPDSLDITLYKINENGEEEKVNATPIWTGTGTSKWTFIYSGLEKYDENRDAIQYFVKETVPTPKNGVGSYTATSTIKEVTSTIALDTSPSTGSISSTINNTYGSNYNNRTYSFNVASDSLGIIMWRTGYRSNYEYHVWTTQALSSKEESVVDSVVKTLFSISGTPEINYSSDTGTIYSNSSYGSTRTANVSVSGSTVSVSFNVNDVWNNWRYGTIKLYDATYEAGTTTLTNTYSTSVRVEKVWDDENNQDGIRPNSVEVVLKADGKVIGDSVTLNKDNNWTYTWTGLSKYKLGEEVSYTVEETNVPSKYTATVTGNATTGFVVTNKYVPETIDVEGTKTWNDGNNQDGKRPDSITVNLLADGEKVASTEVSADKNGNWTYAFNDLPKYNAGKEIKYTVNEEEVAEYASAVNGFGIVNTYVPKTIDVAGTKTWNDGNNRDGKRPDSITVTLLADGKEINEVEVKADKDGNWAYAFEDLPQYRDGGIEIEYTVREAAVSGYATTYDGYNITNTHTPETIDITGAKTWNDADDQDGMRPDSITVNLLADGVEVMEAIVNADMNWTYAFNDLPKYAAGKEIVYTVTEDKVSGYTTTYNGYDITNTHETKETSVAVTKVWDDADNQDGKRPNTITVALYADGEAVSYIELNDENDWTYTWTGLDEYKAGSKIAYTVDETVVPAEYTKTIEKDGMNAFIITNSYVPETIELSVAKVWDDNDNQDGIRPDSIKVTLSNGTEVTLSKTNNWTATVEDLPKYAAGNEIEYSWSEESVRGYTLVSTETEGTLTTFTNKHTPATVEASIKKVWDDNNNQDGIRPDSIRVTLSDGTEVTLNEANDWSATVENLPKYENGQEIVYTWSEESVDGYTLVSTETEGTLTTITNKHVPALTSVAGSKTWIDGNDQDGLRPESIIVNLLADGEVIDSVEVSAEDQWAYAFNNLPKYAAGTEIVYTVSEEKVDGYTTTIDGYNITNTHTPEVMDITVNKTWDDANNQDGKRPESITVNLFANGEVVDTVIIRADENGAWTYVFEDLPKFAEGEEITYSITEDVVDGYTTAIEGFGITNTYTPEKVNVSITKVWDDANNQDGIRPDSITVALSNGTEVTLNEANDWSATVENLPKYENGQEIVYTWSEESVDGYTLVSTETEGTLTTITNKHVPALTSVAGSKTWADGDNVEGLRPESIAVNLLADGEVVDTITVTEEMQWTYAFNNLPKYAAGKEIVYTVSEDAVANYETTIDGYNITNTREVEYVNVRGSKTWDDEDNIEGFRPASITVNLLADGQVVDTITVTEEMQWTYAFTNLQKYVNGKEVEYTVEEVAVANYETTIDGYNITNTREVEYVSVSGTKTWNDENNIEGLRPESITVNLLADGEVVETITVTEEDNWAYEFTNLQKYVNGKEVVYTVSEEAVSGYTTTIDGYNITNTREVEYVSVSGSKTWVDGDNVEGFRPESITVNLLADGEVVDTITVTEEMQWTYAFTNLQKYVDGKEVEYTVSEEAVERYETTIDGYNITNTREVEYVSVSGTKTWIDADDQDGKRPESITVNLLADGEVIETITVTAEDNWAYEFTNLLKYVEGKEVEYTVEEEAVEHYETTIDGYNITNTHTPEVMDITVNKTWNDANNQDGKRPESITVNLFANGEKVDSATIRADENGAWTYVFEDLPKYANGNEITYIITEDVVDGYTTAVEGFGITNTYIPEKVNVSVKKVWDDANNQDGIRPDSITVALSNGTEVVLNAENDWSATLQGLPRYAEGKEIVYTWSEGTVDGYTLVSNEANGLLTTITNKHVPALTSVSGSKTWADGDNVEGLRPESITVNLLADGEVVDTITVTEEMQWTYAFTNLQKYVNGKEVEYTVEEVAVANYETTINGYNITNTREVEYVNVRGSKTWDDEDNIEGFRPASITVNLLADGEVVDTITVTEEMQWTYAFTNLQKYVNGKEVEYTVEEVAVANYETTINGYNITNTREVEYVNVRGSKTWDDEDNIEGFRPASITVNLLADGQVVDTITVTEEMQWTYAFTNLQKYVNGKEVEYTVEEEAVANYETTIDGYNITNTREVEYVSVSGSKTWVDGDNVEGFRPESITVNLLADGEVVDTITVTEEMQWTYAFTNLQKYVDGKEVEYTVSEEAVERYETTIDGYNITNTREVEYVSVSGTKTWNDENNIEGFRPESITVNLLADGEVIKSVEVTADSQWAYEFIDLQKYVDGKEVEYTVEEETVEHYETTIDGYNITNTREVETTEISGAKVWDDADDQDGKRPESITVNLLANGEVVETITVTEETQWTYKFTDLQKYADGKEIVYTVSEEAVEGYTTTIDEFTITNSYTPETTSVNGTKVWDDADDQDGIRPESITVNLLADGEVIETITVTAESEWTYAFNDLPKYKDHGTEIVYTVEEEAVEGYTTTIDGYNITNKHVPETVEVNGMKIWDDADNQDGIRPESITVNLLADGEVIDTIEVSADENGEWTYAFNDLPKYKDHGTEIVYTVEEEAVEEYTTTIDGFNITNTHETYTTEITIVKIWVDENDKDKLRPDSVTVHVYANGEEIGTIKVRESEDWTYTITDLPKYAAGEEIVYTISEDEVKEYTTSIDGYTITNTHEVGVDTGDHTNVGLNLALNFGSLFVLLGYFLIERRRKSAK